MKTLSIRQPWAWLITHGFKPDENRAWDTKVRGFILIHAGKSFDKEGYAWVRDNFPEIELPLPAQFERGGVVGTAELYAVATARSSPWFFGPFGFCLRHARPLPFVPMPGRLGFFEAEHPGAAAFLPTNQKAEWSVEQKIKTRSRPCAN